MSTHSSFKYGQSSLKALVIVGLSLTAKCFPYDLCRHDHAALSNIFFIDQDVIFAHVDIQWLRS